MNILDNGDLRKYRIELPNLIDDMDLSVYAFRLYVHFKRVTGANGGKCFQSARTLAEHCKMSPGTISDAKGELVAAGLIKIQQGDKSKNLSDTITIVDVWTNNFIKYGAENQEHPDREAIRGDREAIRGDREAIRGDREAIIRSNPIKKEPTKKKRERTQPAAAPKPSDHPAVKAYRELQERFPSTLQMKMIMEANPDLPSWIRAIRTWIGRGHNPQNIAGMLEWTANPSLMEKFSGNNTKKETIRNGTGVNNGQVDYDNAFSDEQVERIKTLRREGRDNEVAAYIRQCNQEYAAEKAKLREVQRPLLDSRRT